MVEPQCKITTQDHFSLLVTSLSLFPSAVYESYLFSHWQLFMVSTVYVLTFLKWKEDLSVTFYAVIPY